MSWFNVFNSAKLYNLDYSSSDHSALFMDQITHVSTPGKRAFRFENAWLLEPLCFQLVKDSWEAKNGCSVQEKVSYCGEVLAK
ncbi:hypothetical protein CsatB_026527 [Cannabis sativa]